MVRDLDIYCLRDHHPSNSTTFKVQTQGTTAKKPHPKESKPKKAKSAKGKAPILPQTNIAESLEQGKKNKKNKKRKFQEYKRDHTEEQKEQILATSTNVTDTELKKNTPTLHVTIVIKRVTIQSPAQSLQKN